MQAALAFDETDVSMADNAYLNQDKVVPVRIENNSLEDKELEIEFIGPAGIYYEFSDLPGEIKASMSIEPALHLYASPVMEGTTYDSSLVITLGDETVLKRIKLHVSKNIPIVPEPTPEPTATPTPGEENGWINPAGFISLGFLSIEGILTYGLAGVVIILALVFIAKLWSETKNRRRGYIE